MGLDEDEVARRRVRDPNGRQSTAELEQRVSREQVVTALEVMLSRPALDPDVAALAEIFRFALQQGLL